MLEIIMIRKIMVKKAIKSLLELGKENGSLIVICFLQILVNYRKNTE